MIRDARRRSRRCSTPPSHHRVHHGSNRRYLDRNHGTILIVWDRLFGTFQREEDDEPVVYGLTKNIDTYNPVRIADPRVPRHRPRRGRQRQLARPPVLRGPRPRLGLRPPRRDGRRPDPARPRTGHRRRRLSHAVRLGSDRPRRRRPHHGDADVAARPRRPGHPRPHRAAALPAAATSCARPATPTSSCATSTPRSTGCAARHALRRVPGRRGRRRSCPARTSPPPARSSPRTGPAPSTCSASPASSSSTRSTTGACATGSTAATSTSPTAPPGPTTAGMVEFCSVDDRLLPTCYVPLADFDRAGRDGRRGDRHGRGRPARRRRGCPPGHSPSHVGLDPVWAQAEEAGIPIVFHVGGTGDLIDPNYFVQRRCRSRPTSTAARRTSARSTTWASPARRRRRWRR